MATARCRTSRCSATATRQWGFSAKPSQPIPEHVARWSPTKARPGSFLEPADGRSSSFRRGRSTSWHAGRFSPAAAAGSAATPSKWSSTNQPAGYGPTTGSKLRPSQRASATTAAAATTRNATESDGSTHAAAAAAAICSTGYGWTAKAGTADAGHGWSTQQLSSSTVSTAAAASSATAAAAAATICSASPSSTISSATTAAAAVPRPTGNATHADTSRTISTWNAATAAAAASNARYAADAECSRGWLPDATRPNAATTDAGRSAHAPTARSRL